VVGYEIGMGRGGAWRAGAKGRREKKKK